MRTSSLLPAAVVLALLAACTSEPREGPATSTGASTETGRTTPLEERTFDRNLVLVSTQDDSLVVLAWLFSTRSGSESIERTARGLLLRGGTWEPLGEDTWEGPPMRAPWRLVPHGDLRILVGQGDVLERLVFAVGPGLGELVLDETLIEWSSPRGGTYRVLQGALVLPEGTRRGLLLDMSRNRIPAERRHGDWAFLVSGDSLQVVLHSPTAEPPGSGAWRGWGRLHFRDLRWPVLTMAWPEVRAFEPARRDVPVAWSVTDPDGEISVDLSASGAELQAGPGEGPQFPVEGLFGVTGTLRVEGGAYPVRGVLHHVQR